MSDYEYWNGTLEKIDIPEEYDTWEKQANYLIGKGYKLEDVEYEDECFSDEGSTVYYHTRTLIWYEVIKEEIDASEDIGNASLCEDGKIRFELKYYNGGTCFSEMLDATMNNLHAKWGGTNV